MAIEVGTVPYFITFPEIHPYPVTVRQIRMVAALHTTTYSTAQWVCELIEKFLHEFPTLCGRRLRAIGAFKATTLSWA